MRIRTGRLGTPSTWCESRLEASCPNEKPEVLIDTSGSRNYDSASGVISSIERVHNIRI